MTVVGREQHLAGVIEKIGLLTRDFAASGDYPFKARGLTRAHMNLLFVLSRHEGCSVAQLADTLGVTSGAVSQTVEVLREGGLVTSEVNPADRRGRVIRLTATARLEVDEFERGYLDAIAPRFEKVSDGDLAALGRILGLIDGTPPRSARWSRQDVARVS